MSEFDLIQRYFARACVRRADVALGVGDDCALLRVPPQTELAVSIDTLVAGVHFLPDCDPEGLGHKCLAVGLSDLAAMGAEPAWATLALTLPHADASWLAGFVHGFSRLANEFGVALVGGDTTHGPSSVTVQVHGFVPVGRGVTRGGARPRDLVCVSGTLGDAGLALRRLQSGAAIAESLRAQLERPAPRVGLGIALRDIATAMIDVSDGLAADLGHILEASGCGALVDLDALPLSAEVSAVLGRTGDWGLPMASGDEYELCFTLPPARRHELTFLAERCGVGLQVVGRITEEAGLECRLPDGSVWRPSVTGYDHFPD